MGKLLKDWIVLSGQPIDTSVGGGFELFGPYTESEAIGVRQSLMDKYEPGSWLVLAIQLLKRNP